MKRWTLVLAGLVVLVGVAHVNASVTLQVTYSGDNVIGAFYRDGGSPVAIPLGPNANTWEVADTAVLSGLDYNEQYELILRVRNEPWSSIWSAVNPAALLAEIDGPISAGPHVTDGHWEYAIADPDVGLPDFTSLSWSGVTEYGNNGGDNIWTQNLGSPISGISQDAKWIWSEFNGAAHADGAQPEHRELWLRATVTTAIPEPASLVVWSLIAVTCAGARWRRRKAQ